MADVLLQKAFFAEHGILPANTIREDLYTFPAPDFSNLNGGTLSRTMGRAKFAPSANPANFGWDLGASYSKILVIVGGLRARNFNAGIIASDAVLTSAGEDSYLFLAEPFTQSAKVYKTNGSGTPSQLAVDGTIAQIDVYYGPTWGMAAYIDGVANRLVMMIRVGPEIWTTVHDITDATFTQFSRAGIYFGYQAGVFWQSCPIGIYAE